jgi:hypothetical protein
MMNTHTFAIVAFGIVFFARGLDGQGLSQYRNFAVGSDLASVSTETTAAPPQKKRGSPIRPSFAHDSSEDRGRVASRLAGVSPTEAKTIHERPAVKS